ncbi:MAG: amidohydrolase [Chloroflexi bacterium]|nr:amidohydrolase [Chloroflexota bacterium]
MQPLVIYNARVITLDPQRPLAAGLVVDGERIQAVLAAGEVAGALAGAGEAIDAGGATLVPGFIDTHVHLAVTGLGMLAVDLDGVDAIAGLLERLQAGAAGQPAGALVAAMNFQPELNPENRCPTPEELDAAAGGRPVYVMDRTGHQSVVNHAALAQLELPEGTPGVGRRPDGRFSGVLADEANTQAFTRLWPQFAAQAGLENAYRLAARQAVQGGITTLHALDDLDDVRLLLSLRGQLPVRVVPYTQSKDVAAVQALGLRQIGGCGAVMVDGDFTPHTAALLEPYTDRPETCGKLYYRDEELFDYVAAAHQAGLQVALHCVGSAAIEQLLNVYAEVLARWPRADHRHRIEHFELPAPGQAERARRLGVYLGMQPAFNHYWPHHGEYPEVVGPERAGRVDPLASLLAQGLPVGLGSDSPVTPLRPLLWLHSAVNHSNPAERISVQAALELATRGSSALAFEEKDKGALAPGMLADFVFLDADPYAVPPEQLGAIQVLRTYVGGRLVFDARDEAAA